MDELRIPPEAELLRSAYEGMVPKPSVRALAADVSLSEGRVRQIFKGYQSHGRGHTSEAVAPPETLARIALAVGVTADELEAVGRVDAAKVLTTITDAGGAALASIGTATADLRTWLESADETSVRPPKSALALFGDDQLLDELAGRLEWMANRIAHLQEGGLDAGQAEAEKILESTTETVDFEVEVRQRQEPDQ
ncbi:MAG: hypothetical protein QM804_10150 [Propionicimonas sp.]